MIINNNANSNINSNTNSSNSSSSSSHPASSAACTRRTAADDKFIYRCVYIYIYTQTYVYRSQEHVLVCSLSDLELLRSVSIISIFEFSS